MCPQEDIGVQFDPLGLFVLNRLRLAEVQHEVGDFVHGRIFATPEIGKRGGQQPGVHVRAFQPPRIQPFEDLPFLELPAVDQLLEYAYRIS